jgi:hypothetical protein
LRAVAGTLQVSLLSNGAASVDVTRRRERNNWAIMARSSQKSKEKALKWGITKLWVEIRELLALFYRFRCSGK